jgi:alanyl-tRNA synthetase
VVASSPLVPGNDPTLMFTNSGMVQFKDVFLGTDKRSYVRAASVQACLRAGGKHNDLENVGYTARHHTFFEMLGNWSFGDYFKRDSLKWGWELLTRSTSCPRALLATVYHEDDEAFDIWTKEIGLPPERVIRIGDNKGGKYASDNFWMMADTGPCGPCSRFFTTTATTSPAAPPAAPMKTATASSKSGTTCSCSSTCEPDGSVKLPAPCVDTGMGLERLAAILQHVHSNYEIDIFDALIKAAARETGCTDLDNKSLRVIADHIRATAFLVSDGVTPATKAAAMCSAASSAAPFATATSWARRRRSSTNWCPIWCADGRGLPQPGKSEKAHHRGAGRRRALFETLETGMEILDAHWQAASRCCPARWPSSCTTPTASRWTCRPTCAASADLSVDEAGFNAAMEQQKARAARQASSRWTRRWTTPAQAIRLWATTAHANATKSWRCTQMASVQASSNMAKTAWWCWTPRPFYAESGGQVGDQGAIFCERQRLFEVADTLKIKADVFGHHGTLTQRQLKVGDSRHGACQRWLRAATVRNHSVTHLMHKALREVLGEHVQQKGSLVNAERTRLTLPTTPR